MGRFYDNKNKDLSEVDSEEASFYYCIEVLMAFDLYILIFLCRGTVEELKSTSVLKVAEYNCLYQGCVFMLFYISK